MEEWREIKGYEGRYLISNTGKVRSLITNKMRRLCNNGANYYKVELTDGKTAKRYYVHRLVAETFVPNPRNLREVNHIDSNPANNCAENLEWVTSRENTLHAMKKGRMTLWGNQPKPIRAINVVTNEAMVFETVSKAERYFDSRHIVNVLKGQRKSCKGYRFEYLNGGDDECRP